MWAKKYDHCINCGETIRKHMAKGLCTRCYSHKYAKDPRTAERVKEQKRQWYLKHWRPALQKMQREERWFAGKREAILQRDCYRCSICGDSNTNNLVVHHIDGNGRGSKMPNNDDSNLITVCRACHLALHRPQMPKKKPKPKLNRWARKYDRCIECGTQSIKHAGLGLCRTCYWREKRKKLKI